MRVTNRSIYEGMKTRLGTLTEKLSDANTVITTGKRINKLSDDPTGVSQVVDLRSLISNIDQLKQNISAGKLWLNSEESSLGSIRDLTLDMKTLSINMKNDSYNAYQRETASDSVNATIKQISNLANSTIKGQYIFSGTKTYLKPVALNDETNPTKISYQGNQTPFGVKIGQANEVPVGLIGKDLFWEDYTIVDSTNNKVDFSEEIVDGNNVENIKTGDGILEKNTDIKVKNYSALIHSTPTENFSPLRFRWDGDSHWIVDNNPGYDLTDKIKGSASGFNVDLDNDGKADIEVNLSEPPGKTNAYIEFDINPGARKISATIPDGKYSADELSTAIAKSMSEASTDSSYGIKYNVKYDSDKKSYTFKDDGSYPGLIGFNLLWATGANKGISIGPDLGYDVKDVKVNLATSDDKAPLFTFTNNNNMIDFVEYPETGGNSGQLTATIANGTYRSINDVSKAIEDALETASVASPSHNNINYKVTYDKINKKFIIKEDGTALNQLDILWQTGTNTAINAAHTLGFNVLDDSVILPISDNAVAGPNITIDGTNNRIDFKEVNEITGTSNEIGASIPGGVYNMDDLAKAVEKSMNATSPNEINYRVKYDAINQKFSIKPDDGKLNELDLLWNTGQNAANSIALTIGFNNTADRNLIFPKSDEERSSMIVIDNTNNKIDFKEKNELGFQSKQLNATIASAIINGTSAVTGGTLNTGDLTINGIDIAALGALTIQNNDSDLTLTDAINNNNALKAVGITAKTYKDTDDKTHIRLFSDNAPITIAGASPSTIAHFKAGVVDGYFDPKDLAIAIEDGMEKVSVNQTDYAVSYRGDTNRFTIEENTTSLEELQLLWKTGVNTLNSIGDTLGFKTDKDKDVTFATSDNEVEWGLFKTLMDFRKYLKENDTDGIGRSMTRLDTHYAHMVASVSDIGQRETRMDVKEKIVADLNISYQERRSTIEDADFVDAIADFKTRQAAYEAALASSSKILNISLVDYLK